MSQQVLTLLTTFPTTALEDGAAESSATGAAAWMGAAVAPCCCCVHRATSAARQQQCWGCYLVVDVAHGEVLLGTGAGCTDVLQPGPSSALVGIDAEFLVSQVVSNLWEAMQRSVVMEW